MTKVQKWFAKLRNRIFFSFVGCFLGIMLLIMGVFQFSSQKYFSQLAVSGVFDPEQKSGKYTAARHQFQHISINQ